MSARVKAGDSTYDVNSPLLREANARLLRDNDPLDAIERFPVDLSDRHIAIVHQCVQLTFMFFLLK